MRVDPKWTLNPVSVLVRDTHREEDKAKGRHRSECGSQQKPEEAGGREESFLP